MCSLFPTSLAFALVLWLAAVPAQTAQPFRICAEPDNLPMSDETTRSGFEVEVAQLLADDMGRPLEVVWVSQRDHSFYRSTINSGGCDALMSVPSAIGALTTTRPWYRSGYYFVSRSGAPQSFDDPVLKSETIGVQATGLGETPPAIALTRRGLGEHMHPFPIYEPHTLMEAVANRQVDLAVVWGPFAGWYSAKSPELRLTPTPDSDFETPLAFDLSVGVRKGNDALVRQVNASLDHMAPAIAAVMMRYHIPMRRQ